MLASARTASVVAIVTRLLAVGQVVHVKVGAMVIAVAPVVFGLLLFVVLRMSSAFRLNIRSLGHIMAPTGISWFLIIGAVPVVMVAFSFFLASIVVLPNLPEGCFLGVFVSYVVVLG